MGMGMGVGVVQGRVQGEREEEGTKTWLMRMAREGRRGRA